MYLSDFFLIFFLDILAAWPIIQEEALRKPRPYNTLIVSWTDTRHHLASNRFFLKSHL